MSSKVDNEKPADKSKDYREAVEERVKKEAEVLAAAKETKGTGGDPQDEKITSKFIQQCLGANELGDGMLYAAIHKNKFLYNKSTGSWMEWTGHHWCDDIRAKSLAAVEKVALRYLEESQKVGNDIGLAVKNDNKEAVASLQKFQDQIHKRIFRLRSDRGRTNCLKFAFTNPVNALDITSEHLDTNPWLFGCKNGVIDLRTGRLRPGRQDDYISMASSIEFMGIETPAPNWEEFLIQIFNEHQSLVDYVGRVFGYSMVGKVVEHFLPILWGRGWNGKGTLIEIIAYVMGDLASPIQSEMLLDQSHGKSAGSASPEVMGLRGLRLAYASETEQGRRFSTSKVKWLTGGDTLKGRFLYDKRDVKFSPSHMLTLMTNNKPNVLEDDYAFWQRVHLVPFELSFVTGKPDDENERPADKNLYEKLLAEAPGILAWLIKGCLEWQSRGLDPPPRVIKASKEYRQDEDLLGHFIEDCCYTDPQAETPAKDLYDAFKKWWEENVSRKVLSQKRWGGMMVKKFGRRRSGTYRYLGIGLNDEIWP